MDLLPFLYCLHPYLSHTNIRRLGLITSAILSMSGRVTMLGISRWTEAGGSYRSVQRFYETKIQWEQVHWKFIHTHLKLESQDDVVLLAADEVTTPKSGKYTHGLERFFSSVHGKPIPSVCHLQLSLVSVNWRTAYPLLTEQLEKAKETEETKYVSKKKSDKGKKGRKKGSKNKDLHNVKLTPLQATLQNAVNTTLKLTSPTLKLTYLVYDGAMGHNNGVQLTRQTGLHLISKLRYDAELYLPYEGPYAGRGPRRKYGERLHYHSLPQCYLKSTETEDNPSARSGHRIRTDIFQMTVRHKKFADMLNIVVIVKTNLENNKIGHVILFSSDLDLTWDKLVDYYRLRFQIEFNFRDAKQYWGLDDFMNIKARQVENAANLAFFMVNVSHALRQLPECSGMSVLDLKAWFRAGKYVRETLKLLGQIPEEISIDAIVGEVAALGRINQPKCLV